MKPIVIAVVSIAMAVGLASAAVASTITSITALNREPDMPPVAHHKDID